jgi:hypothetical protein
MRNGDVDLVGAAGLRHQGVIIQPSGVAQLTRSGRLPGCCAVLTSGSVGPSGVQFNNIL